MTRFCGSFLFLWFVGLVMAITNENLVKSLQDALQFHKNGDFQSALTLYETILPHLSGKIASQISSNAGAIYLQQGDIEAAVQKFQQAVEITPENAESHFNLAVILNSKLNKHVLAIKHCRLAMKYDPNMYKAYHLMGNILQDIDKPEEAVKYFTLAERIANAGSIEANNSASEPNPTTLSPSTAYQNLWIWGARINHTYVFKRNNDIWESQIILPDEQPQSHTCISESFDVLEMKCLSERPLIFEVPHLLSYGECDHILTRAGPLLKSSHVMGEGAHSYTKDSSGSEPYRRSMNAWLSRDDVLAQMQSRVAVLTGIPKSYVQIMSEDLQVIKYDMEGQFKLHQDSSQFHPRLLTALVYLQDSDGQFAGGETWFPFAPGSRDQDENNSNLETIDQAIDSIQDILEEEQQFPSQIPRKGLTFSPSKGKAILFFNHLPDGRVDTLALHSGRKLLEGTKWAANYWIKLDPARLDQIANS